MRETSEDYARLNRVRRAAERFLAPWGDTRNAADLSPARIKAVTAALEQLAGALGDPRGPAAQSDATGGTRHKMRRKRTVEDDMRDLNPRVEDAVGVQHDELAALMLLDAFRGFGPAKFRGIFEQGISPSAVLRNPDALPMGGKTGDSLRRAIATRSSADEQLARERAARQIVVAHENEASILTYTHPLYPPNLLRSNNPVPILYAKGDLQLLREWRAVACVGSRAITGGFEEAHYRFARHACKEGWIIVSGFATGADTVGHRAALENGGATIAVMPSGLDRPFPPENKSLWRDLLISGQAAMVSEFPFGTSSNRLNLQKRNKTIVAASLGVLISQTAATGGAMNAFRFAVEQRKPVATFLPGEELPGGPDISGNRTIAEERRVPSKAFGLRVAPKEWGQWLNVLSSSI